MSKGSQGQKRGLGLAGPEVCKDSLMRRASVGPPRPPSEITLSPPSIGGSIPIVFSYYSEFLAQEKRGEHLSWLCMFWMIGGIYASAMAWAIIPHYGESWRTGGKERIRTAKGD